MLKLSSLLALLGFYHVYVSLGPYFIWTLLEIYVTHLLLLVYIREISSGVFRCSP